MYGGISQADLCPGHLVWKDLNIGAGCFYGEKSWHVLKQLSGKLARLIAS
jgi:hypothetical protein